MEVRIKGRLNGLVAELESAGLVHVEAAGMDWIRYSVPDPYETNPALLRYLAGQGVDVVTLSPITRTLEDIYLQAVREDEGAHNGTHDESI